jgi:hypothetical protein
MIRSKALATGINKAATKGLLGKGLKTVLTKNPITGGVMAGLGAVTGIAGSLLGSKGEEGRFKNALKAGVSGAIQGPIGAGLIEGIKDRKDINQAEKAQEEQDLAMNAFMANQPTPVDLNQGNQTFVSPQQTPGTNGTAPANPTFNQDSFNQMSAIADPTQDTYGSLFT